MVPTLQDADAVSRPKKTLKTTARVLEETEETVGFSKVDHLTHQFYWVCFKILLKFQPEILVKVPVFYYFSDGWFNH